jgi:aspartyl-tRNA(Asn)/glutamyl-tRNA(Gln) amidotransferase subunit A
MTLAEAAGRIREGSLSSTDLTRAVLDRALALNDATHAFITITGERALDQAASRDEALRNDAKVGPLHGVPIAVKDLIDVRGVRTTAGSPMFGEGVPDRNAIVVDRLEGAGAVIVGKTNLHEFAFGVTNVNPHFGAARNPWDRERMSGGSSGGSAVAVALSMSIAAIGTDTGGSIRIPAALSGIVGLKPTYGRVPLAGVVPLAHGLDHVGPMTRTVEDAAIVLGVIAGEAETASHESSDGFLAGIGEGVGGLRLGVPRTAYFQRLETGVGDAVQAALGALKALGAELVDTDLPDTSTHEDIFRFIATSEAYRFHRTRLESEAERIGEDVRRRLMAGKDMLAVDIIDAERQRAELRDQVNAVFDDVDVLVFPTLPITAPLVGQDAIDWSGGSEAVLGALTRNTRLANLTGLPAISVPCGFSSGLPVGLQVVGPANRESRVIRVAAAYERLSGWNLVPPEV